jgi:4-amino-4-deoxy-L-arabinose transferase-like glycosyltransferase
VLRRFAQLLAGAGAMVAAAGWWVAIVELVPASSRPYIGGSQDNSVWNLMFGYNGFGRLTGNEVGSVGGGGTGQGGRWGLTGLGRLANAEFGSQIAWLLPASLILLVAGLVISRRASRTNRTRAGLLLWGGWLVVTALTFSLGKGIIHPYYSVALAPPIGALIGIGGSLLWARRRDPVARSVLAATLALTSVWSYALLDRTPTWHPALRTLVAVAGVGLAVALLAVPHIGRWGSRAVAAGAVVVALAGPGAYSVATAATPHSGAIPSAGPAGAGGFGPGAGRGGPAGAAFTGGGAAGGNAAGGRGGIGGLLNGTTPTAALTAFLQQGSDRYTWVAATVGSNNAAGYQLATGDPVMAIGGFNGTDPAPTLAQFQADVAAGRIHFFLGGGGFGGGGAQGTGTTTVSTASQITAWVTSGFSSSTVGGTTVYDLTAPVG